MAAHEAGASIVHFHGPHDEKGRIIPERWGDLVRAIHKRCDVLIDFGQAGAPLDQRKPLLELGPDKPDFMAVSLTNHDYRRRSPERGEFDVYYQHPRDELEEYARLLAAAGVKPAWEIWHLGGVWNLNYLIDKGLVAKPYWLNLFFGTPGSVWAPPTVEEITHRIANLPPDAPFLLAPRGTAGPMGQTRMLTSRDHQGRPCAARHAGYRLLCRWRAGAEQCPDRRPHRPHLTRARPRDRDVGRCAAHSRLTRRPTIGRTAADLTARVGAPRQREPGESPGRPRGGNLVTFRNLVLIAAAASILTFTHASISFAQSVADFYKGRNVTILVGCDAGCGYDIYSRVLARYWVKHIPGNPGIIIQNMPGANGITMMNSLVNTAAQERHRSSALHSAPI